MKEYIFETERLAVRKFKPEDAKRLYELHRDDEVKKWIPGEYYEDIDEAREGTEFFADCVDAGKLPFVLAYNSFHTILDFPLGTVYDRKLCNSF